MRIKGGTHSRCINLGSPPQYTNYLNQFVLFFLCRAFTGVLDIIIMVLAVDYLQLNSLLWKFISNIIITIINYALSKFFIFKKLTEK